MKKLLTQSEEEKLKKIMNDESDMWTDRGYNDGIMCEDSQTPFITYSEKSQGHREKIERIVELRTGMVLAKQKKHLS